MAQGEWGTTARLIEAALEILENEHPATVRQVFYRMVSVRLIENTPAAYGRISRILTKARRDSRLPYEWICDRSRPVYQPSVWTNPADYAATVKRGYRKDYWHMQPNYVEIWVEKDSVIGSIEPVTRRRV